VVFRCGCSLSFGMIALGDRRVSLGESRFKLCDSLVGATELRSQFVNFRALSVFILGNAGERGITFGFQAVNGGAILAAKIGDCSTSLLAETFTRLVIDVG
jgi:hypothetical protein